MDGWLIQDPRFPRPMPLPSSDSNTGPVIRTYVICASSDDKVCLFQDLDATLTLKDGARSKWSVQWGLIESEGWIPVRSFRNLMFLIKQSREEMGFKKIEIMVKFIPRHSFSIVKDAEAA